MTRFLLLVFCLYGIPLDTSCVPGCVPFRLPHPPQAAVQADRMKYLLSQSKLFRHFLGDARSSPPPPGAAAAAVAAAAAKKAAAAAKDAPDSATKRRRLTEKEEDAQLLRTEEAELPPTTRLAVQPANIKGEMRPYQLEGLNFLISLFERGVNGILADEMGLVRLGCKRWEGGEWGR